MAASLGPAAARDDVAATLRVIGTCPPLGAAVRVVIGDLRCVVGRIASAGGMEHLWSHAGATGGNQSQMEERRERLKQRNPHSLATNGNRFELHGKEGVDGSSPSEVS